MEAMLALGLARPSIIAPIVALLRSNAPLDPAVRTALADAFEGMRPGGAPQFVVRGTGRGAHVGLSIANFDRDVSIARFITEQQSKGISKKDALSAAADKYRMSEKHCEAATTKTAKMDRWLSSNPPDEQESLVIRDMAPTEHQRFRERMFWGRFIFSDQT